MGARQPEIYEGLRIKNLRSNWRKTCQVFPVPKPQYEPPKRKHHRKLEEIYNLGTIQTQEQEG